ncbi:PQ-loop-domain-containing protein, partial [Rickenella mellea]
QVMENIRRQSCDGLALPFLANWLLGDLTNLLGCILTKQLPFQTWLAAYFVSVDFMLFSQYFYYRTPSPKLAPSSYTPHPHPHPHAQHIPHQLHASIHRDSLQHSAIVQTQPQAHPYPQVYPHHHPHPHPPSHPHQPTHAQQIGTYPYPHARLRALESAAANLARLLGRISAWACTTLYLTSRLPQIWKNYVRKSVDGLSMALFVFAFLGNTFYVMSILTNPALDAPRAEATAFLRESVPYLLGSGGTLCFDVTIVVQSFLYRTPP